MPAGKKFVVATPGRSVCDDNARALFQVDALRFLALGTRRGTGGIPSSHTRLNPLIGLLSYAAARTVSTYRAESFRFSLLPMFDRWVKRQLAPGDHIISSYGYANDSFAWIQQHGGKTFVDAGNSHPESFWEIMIEEHRRWKCSLPPVSPFWIRRSVEMLRYADYILCPSTFVRNSFLCRGFKPEQILRNVYPVDLSCFTPSTEPRPSNRPLTVISTALLTLRKGTPYMLEAFRIISKRHPSARFLLTRLIHDSVRELLDKYDDLPIDWAPALPHAQLAARLREADVFVLPSLEEGLARTAAEAMACGLPVVLTPNTGTNDLVTPGVNGEIVPIRDPGAIADAILRCFDRSRVAERPKAEELQSRLSFNSFSADFLAQLRALKLLPA